MSDNSLPSLEPVPVRIERRANAVWITIDREERRNAINQEILFRLGAAITSACSDPEVRAIVLTGAGRKAFCAGADLSRGTGVFAMGLDEPTTDFGRLARTVRDCGVPLVGRINGDCIAGGMGLLALCDLVVASDSARFALPEVKVGVFPMQVIVFLRRMIHPIHLKELCLTGGFISAVRAREIGLANDVVPFEQLDQAVESIVERVSLTSPVAIRRGKRVVASMESMCFEEALSFAEAQIAIASRTSDAEEGLAAFNEKRKPRWIVDGGLS